MMQHSCIFHSEQAVKGRFDGHRLNADTSAPPFGSMLPWSSPADKLSMPLQKRSRNGVHPLQDYLAPFGIEPDAKHSPHKLDQEMIPRPETMSCGLLPLLIQTDHFPRRG